MFISQVKTDPTNYRDENMRCCTLTAALLSVGVQRVLNPKWLLLSQQLDNSVRPVVRIILGSVAQSLSQSVVIQSQAELAVVGNSWDFHGE